MTAVTERARRLAVTLGPVLIVFVVQQVLFPVPAGVFLHGVVIGLLTSMIAVGMALIYRANRVLNFAQGDLGYVPASLSVMIVITSSIPWLVAFGAGIAVAAALGAACELLVIRRFFKAPRLVLTVATLGMSQLLAFGGLLLPRLFDNRVRSQRVDPPFRFDFDFGGQRFNANHLLVLIIAPLAMGLVGLFLQRTAVGVAIRAAADRAERASLLGVPVRGLHTIVWSIAGVLAFLALFLRSGVIGLPIGSALSLGVLMRALAALMLGRMTNLTTIALSGVAIGVLQMGVDWNGIKLLDQQSPLLIEPVVALVAIAALMIRRKDVSRFETDSASSWSAADEVRPIPPELARLPEIKIVRWGALALLSAGILLVPHWVATDTNLKISLVFIYVLVAASIVVVTGWAGQVSLAQVAFMAVGAVAGAKASNEWGFDLSLALLFAGVVGLVTAVIIGLPALRVKGLFLAVTTLGFGLATSNWLLSPRFFDFVPSSRIDRLPLFGQIDLNSPTRIYYVCLAVAVLVLFGLRGVRHSRTGRVLLALRENERATQAFGISAVRAKLTAFAISGFVAAVAGALYVHHQQSYDFESYSPNLSIVMFTAAVVGGLGSLTGGVLGAVWLEGGYFLLPGNWRYFASSIGVLFVLLVIPGGLGSLVYKVRDVWLRWVANRREILVPSMIADKRVEAAPPPPPPTLVVGGVVIASAGPVIAEDVKQVWQTATARSEVAYERRHGRSKLLLVRGINVSYGPVQVLFNVDLEIDEGEIVALLGTNGAGKSTLLKAISGVVEAHRGSIIFDGLEMTHTPPAEIAGRGVMQVPGGVGTFPSLTVEENLQTAAWLERRHKAEVQAAMTKVDELFPILGERRHQPAANLSGGQQQMLALSMAFLTKPRLLMIDELSLGLAPVVVEQLLPVLREIRDQGTTIILVEQSVNVALTLAETAYFMEKGEIRFSGKTEELLNRPDLLRSVFLEGAGKAVNGSSANGEQPVTEKAKRDRAEGVALETIDLTRAFGGIRAVDEVSVQVAPGEIVGIIGPNGAGKTTLFDVISGFTPHDSGRIVLAGQDISTLSPNKRARRGLGRSFQDAKLFPAMTVEEAMAVSLERFVEQRDPITAALHLPMAFDSEINVKKRVDELIELMGLEAFRSKFLRELSTGSRRIVDLACVVAHRPTVILFDEPSSGIAQKETEALAPLLLRIREGLGAALMVIEHDMPLVIAVADRLIAMDQGRVIAEGDPDEVLRHPAVVASYLGSNADVLARSGAGASS